MSQRAPKPVYDIGGAPTTAPSVPRVDVSGWLLASGALGAAAATVALNLLWRPLPGLDGPPGSLAFHAGQAARWAVHWLAPSLFCGEAKSYAATLGKLGGGERLALAWRGCAGLVAACAPAVLLARGCLAPRDGLVELRGSRRIEGAQAARRLRAEMSPKARSRPDHPIAPGIPYPADMWTRHALVVAGTGSGKSTVLKPLIEAVVAAGESLLLFDPKGEFTKGFGGPEILAPWDARSLAWDIAKDMRNIGDMRRFAGAMIREAHDPMWSNAARQLLVGFMIYLKATRGADWGWRQLAEMMAAPQSRILPIMVEHHPEAVRAVERASVTTQGILINLASFSSSIFDLAEAWGDAPPERRVSFVEWTRQGGGHRQLILQGHGAYPDLTKSYLEGALGTVSAIVNSVEMDDDPSRKLWLIADEAAQMGKAPIRALLEVGRSRGVRCVFACQDLAQLEEIHGQHLAKSLASMVGTLLIGQMMPGDTAEQLCKTLGSREVERLNVSTSSSGAGHSSSSTTLSFSRDELAIYKPSELASRLGPTRDGKGVKLALFTGGVAYELFWPHYQMRRARPAHVPAEWTRGFGRGEDALVDGEGAAARGGGAGSGSGAAVDWESPYAFRDPSISPQGEILAHPSDSGDSSAGVNGAGVGVGLGAGAGAGLAVGSGVQSGGQTGGETGHAPDGGGGGGRGADGGHWRSADGGIGRSVKATPLKAPTAEAVASLLRQSVQVRAEPLAGRAAVVQAHSAGRPDVGAKHGRASKLEAGVELLVEAEKAIGEIGRQGHGDHAGHGGLHRVGGEGLGLLVRAAEFADAMRPGPGPAQVVEVATEDQERRRGGHHPSEAKSKAGQMPSRT